MLKIYLFTSTDVFVENVYIPPFNQLPNVIIWGVRLFQYSSDKNPDDNTEQFRYTECFSCGGFTKTQMASQGINIED